MKLFLRSDLSKLGRAGDLVEVADGYARNYLLPRNLAFLATPENEKRIRAERKCLEARELERLDSLKELGAALSGRSVTIGARANEEQKLFGSVGADEIVESLRSEHGVEIEPGQVLMEEHIRQLGVYDVKLRLAPDTETEIKVWVVGEE
jgi:large subunit ribosomal protein L9